MMYFIILPIYMLLLLVLLIAALVARNIESLRPASGYIVGATVGSLPGFIIVNLIIMRLFAALDHSEDCAAKMAQADSRRRGWLGSDHWTVCCISDWTCSRDSWRIVVRLQTKEKAS
jgi:hypothetical protein